MFKDPRFKDLRPGTSDDWVKATIIGIILIGVGLIGLMILV